MRKAQARKSDVSQSLYILKDAANMLNFLTANNIMDMAGFDEKFSSMIGQQIDIRDKLKPIEQRLTTLKKHIEQADLYMKYKSKKALTDSKQILFTAAHSYLKDVLNGRTSIPAKAWKAEYAKLTAEQKTLNRCYLVLKDEVKQAEQIRKSVYSILRQAQRAHQPKRAQEVDRSPPPVKRVARRTGITLCYYARVSRRWLVPSHYAFDSLPPLKGHS